MTDFQPDRCLRRSNQTRSDHSHPREIPYPYLLRLLHWLLALSIPVLFVTGISLHAAARPDWSLVEGGFPQVLLEGRMNFYHLIAALIFAPSLIATAYIYGRHLLRNCKWSLESVVNVCLVTSCLLMVLSSVILRFLPGTSATYAAGRGIHAVGGLVLVPVAYITHVALALYRHWSDLIPAFHPWAQPNWRPIIPFLVLALVTTCVILNGLPIHSRTRDLLAKRISGEVTDLTALPWDEAPPLKINLANGAAFEGGRTQVVLRALHNGSEIFFLAEWGDPKEDRRYMPWEKTADGWHRLVSREDDESVYYEDKFALIFPTVRSLGFERFGCATYCHLGGGRAYGYKGSNHIVDVWHWKSSRSDPVGQVDDKYWLGFDFEAADVGRYGDPKLSGGYEKNVSEDKSLPAFLPAGPGAVKQGALLREHAVPYSPETAARVSVGEVIPGIVVSAAEGDRGNVQCISKYGDGGWRLYMRRRLDTASKYDVKFVPGARYSFGCAAFDRSSKRHAYNLKVYRLLLEE